MYAELLRRIAEFKRVFHRPPPVLYITLQEYEKLVAECKRPVNKVGSTIILVTTGASTGALGLISLQYFMLTY